MAFPTGGPGASADTALARRDTFEVLLYGIVRRAAPWALSAAIHAAAAFAAVALAGEPAPPPAPRERLALASVSPMATEVDSGVAEEEATGIPVPASIELPVPRLPLTAEEARIAVADPEEGPSPPLPSSGLLPSTISVGPRVRVAPPKPLAPVFEGNPTFSGEGAEVANREAAGLLLKGVGGAGRGDGALLRRLDPRRIHVCEGCYDSVESVFELLGIKHDTLTLPELSEVPLTPDGLLVIDCGSDMISKESAAAVRDFVESGGFLCTTDWGLENVIEPAFPGVLRSLYRGGRGVATEDITVPFKVTAKEHPLTRGISPVSEGALWWVEAQAHPIEVTSTANAVVLAESAELKARYGSGILAVTFPWGKGRVLHLLGHAWQKQGNLKGAYGIQRLLLNFLLERAGTASSAAAPAAPASRGR